MTMFTAKNSSSASVNSLFYSIPDLLLWRIPRLPLSRCSFLWRAHCQASTVQVCMYVCLCGPLGCRLPPALHPGDSIKADRWSRPVQDSEHERPVLPPPFLQIIKPTLFPRINALSSGGWMEWAAESSQAWPFLLNLFPPWLHLYTRAQRPGLQPAPPPCIWHSDATLHFWA